jgi:hypothetical protein
MSNARTMGGWVIKSDRCELRTMHKRGKKMHDRNERKGDNKVVVGVTHR